MAGKIPGYIPKTEPIRSILTIRAEKAKRKTELDYVAIFFTFWSSHRITRDRSV